MKGLEAFGSILFLPGIVFGGLGAIAIFMGGSWGGMQYVALILGIVLAIVGAICLVVAEDVAKNCRDKRTDFG